MDKISSAGDGLPGPKRTLIRLIMAILGAVQAALVQAAKRESCRVCSWILIGGELDGTVERSLHDLALALIASDEIFKSTHPMFEPLLVQDRLISILVTKSV